MPEQFVPRMHAEPAVLDIGGDVGALIVYTGPELHGKEIEASLKQVGSKRIHTDVLERRVNGQQRFAALFLELLAGDYTLWRRHVPTGEVTITGGAVAVVDWRTLTEAALPYSGWTHDHEHATVSRPPVPPEMLPPRYRNGKPVNARPMGSAPMRYTEDGQVAWHEMWTDFCDLALAGGPPHRGTLLEPVGADEVRAEPIAYGRVVAEIERGFAMVTDLPIRRSDVPGWVGLQCESAEMAAWLLYAIEAENVTVRYEETTLFLPAGPAFRLEYEVKNVITAVAKTYHYWTEHRDSQRASSALAETAMP